MSLIPQLEGDLVRAARRQSRRRRMRPSNRRTGAAVALAALVLGGGAAAATGVLSVGSVFRGEGFRTETRKAVAERVVASGRAPVSGPWRMTTFKTAEGVRCLKAELLAPPPSEGRAARATGYCGYLGGFPNFGHGGKRAARKRGEVLLFGRAPARARKVRLTSAGARPILARARRGPAGSRDSYWLLAAPPGLKSARLEWLDQHGDPGGRTIDVAYRFEGPTGRVVAARGTTRLTGAWRLTAYESRGHVSGGDRYEPEGLPGIELSLSRGGPGGRPSRGGGSGVIANAPGFSRGQHTLRAGMGSIKDPVTGIVFYGRAPAEADLVRIAAKGGVRIEIKTRRAPPGLAGRFWFHVTSRIIRDGHMRWVDTDTGREGPAVAVLPP